MCMGLPGSFLSPCPSAMLSCGGKAGSDCSLLALGGRPASTQALQPVRGWRQQEQSREEALLPMVGDLCEGTGKEDGSLTKGSRGASELCRSWGEPGQVLITSQDVIPIHTQGFSGPDWPGLPATSLVCLLPHSLVEPLWELQGSVSNTPGPGQTPHFT